MKNLKLITDKKNLSVPKEKGMPAGVTTTLLVGMGASVSMLLIGCWAHGFGNSADVVKIGLSHTYEQVSQLYLYTGGAFLFIFGLCLMLSLFLW